MGAVLMLSGIAVTDLAFRVSQVALPLVVLASTGSAAATGLVGGASGIPVLLSPWWARHARQWVDRGSRVAACYLGEIAALAVVAACATLGWVQVGVLAAAGLTLGVAEALSGPGRDALVADLGDELGPDRALSLLNTRDFFRRAGMVVGPAIGGVAVAAGHAVAVLWVEVGAIAFSALLAMLVPRRAVHPVVVDSEAMAQAPRIWSSVRQVPDVLAGWVIRGSGCFLWFAFSLGLAVLGAHRGVGGAYLAAGMTAYGVGSVLGTLGVVAVVRRVPVLPAAAIAWLVTAVAWVVMGSR
jgi:MFS family permease